MGITLRKFGQTERGEEVTVYTLTNKLGTQASFLNYGAILVELKLADRLGKMEDVVLGYQNLEGYIADKTGFGSFIGRHANRIAKAEISLNNQVYKLDKNEGENNLHSGFKGYNKYIYDVTYSNQEDNLWIEFRRTSPHMEQGFPGNLEVSVKYILTEDNQWIIQYNAISDEDTVVNLTNHTYFNLAGHNSGDILKHMLWLDADYFTPTDDALIPTGEMRKVAETPMDFRTEKAIGKDILCDYEPLTQGKGYDHNYCLNHIGNSINKVATLRELQSGRCMEVYTDMPAIQLYTGNYLDESVNTKEDVHYQKNNGVCFETQFVPNACNCDQFESSVLKAGEVYKYTTIYKFNSTRYTKN